MSEIPAVGLTVLGLMGGVIQNGIETIFDLIDFDEKVKEADLVDTTVLTMPPISVKLCQ
ncbi:MAG: hypothetical protein RIC06_17245 [Cyclobacteriaceae bacterium]